MLGCYVVLSIREQLQREMYEFAKFQGGKKYNNRLINDNSVGIGRSVLIDRKPEVLVRPEGVTIIFQR